MSHERPSRPLSPQETRIQQIQMLTHVDRPTAEAAVNIHTGIDGGNDFYEARLIRAAVLGLHSMGNLETYRYAQDHKISPLDAPYEIAAEAIKDAASHLNIRLRDGSPDLNTLTEQAIRIARITPGQER